MGRCRRQRKSQKSAESMEFCVGAQSLAPCMWRCRIKGWVVGGGRVRRLWIEWGPDG